MSKHMLIGLLQLDLEEFQDLHEVEMKEAIDKLNSIRESLKVQLTEEDKKNFESVEDLINSYDNQMIAANKAALDVLNFLCKPCTQEGREKTWDNQDCETVSDSIVDGLKIIMDLCNITMGEVLGRTETFNSYVARYQKQVCEYVDDKRHYGNTRQSAEFFRKSIRGSFKDAENTGNFYVKSCSGKIIDLFKS